MSQARRIALSVLAVLALGLLLGACGSSGGSSSATASANQQQRPRGGFFNLTAAQRSCLQKQGVTLPNRPQGQGPPPSGQPGAPPNGQQGAPPNGQPPTGRRFNRDPAQFKKLRTAAAKCGITLRGPGQGAPPGAGQTQTQPSAAS